MWTRGHTEEDRKIGDVLGSQTDPELSREGRDTRDAERGEEHTLSQSSQAQENESPLTFAYENQRGLPWQVPTIRGA